MISLANKRDWSLNLLKSDSSLVRLNIVSSLQRTDLAASMAGVMKGFVLRGAKVINFCGACLSRRDVRVDVNN